MNFTEKNISTIVSCSFKHVICETCKPDSEVIKFYCMLSTKMSMTFIMLINVKMLTFISMIDTTSTSLKAKIVFIFSI